MNKTIVSYSLMGHEGKTITGYSLAAVVDACVPFIEDGWYVHEHKTRREWPFFWIVEHKVEIRRDYIAVVPEAGFSYVEKIPGLFTAP